MFQRSRPLTAWSGARLGGKIPRVARAGRIFRRSVLGIVGLCAFAGPLRLSAQGSTDQLGPALRQLGPQIARARDSLGSSLSICVLSDGRVLVNDRDRRRVLLLDPHLGGPRTIMDSTGQARRRYSNTAGGLIRYRGDTTLFIDPDALAFVAILPSGAIGKTTAIPPDPSLLAALLGTGTAAFDPSGRLVYRDAPDAQFLMGKVVRHPRPATGATTRDTTAILRLDLTTHRTDTLGTFSTQRRINGSRSIDSAGHHFGIAVMNPILLSDDFALLEDGSVALIRAQDYHVDWITPAGVRESSPRIPHEWHRLTDSAKAAIVDSMKRYNAAHARHVTQYDQRGQFAMDVVDDVVDPAQLADYPAPFLPGARADAEGDVWVRQPSGSAAGSVYDIVDRRGALTDRVELPGGTTLVGFGPGVVYVSAREAWGASLATYRIR